jgi:TP901 family phage tail tape measure protein
MAGNIGDLQVNLSANTSQMERDVSAALKRLESKGFNFGAGINSKAFTQPLGRITGASNEFQKSLDASNARVIAFGASAGAIYTVQKAFTSLISSTIDVQKSLTDINVILGASQRSLGQFGDSLFEIAKNSGQAFSTVATAAGELARQGLTLEQTLKRTSDALILARLSGLDAASSVEALTASINSFSTAALDSTQIVNKLAAVDSAFAVSSGDLAEALKRVGSSAQDVGVDFDELLAIVASVNQTTARGGAVIGNSLKTIFTRVQRTEVLDQLEGLGIAVRDLSGNTAPAIQVLTGLANKFDQLGSAQKGQVAELVGGVFQINILKAALGDLSKEYSVFGNALNISRGATDEAIRRNEDLNKTLSALLNKTVANLTRVGSDIGGLSFAPAIEKVLGGINTALESFDVKGDGIGSKIGKGIFEGIGSFISGPGLALLIGVFIKIFGNLARFTTDAVKTVLGLNKEAQAQAQIQERINSILAQNPQLIQNILNKQVSLLQVEKDILTVIQAQSQARQQSTAIAATLTRGLISKGVTADKGVISTKTKSQGFIPNFNANKEMMGAIAGGYMPGQVRSMNIPNYGRVTYNDAETVKQFSGLSQPGIMPPADSEAGKAYKQKFNNKYGINPYASNGFVPNFARPSSQTQVADMINQGYVRIAGSELKAFAQIGVGKLDSIQNQFGIVPRGSESYIPQGKYNKFVYASKKNLETVAADKGDKFGKNSPSKVKDYALVYPGFDREASFPTFGTTKGGKQLGYYAVPFPGQLKSKKNALVGPGLYGGAINALVDSSSSFLTGLAGVSPNVINTSKFKRYLKSNITQDQVGSLVGNLFEGGILAALDIVPTDRTRGLDLNPKELQLLGKTFKMPFLQNTGYLGGDFKNSLSLDNRNSMAEKVATNMGINKALGFIPNFSPIDKALKTEKKMGGKGVLDFKPGLGLYVRDGKTQPNFAAVMRDHPEGIGNAVQNSKKMQSSMSAGFIPNFAGIDPMSLFFMMQSMGGAGGGSEQMESKLERGKLATILRDRRAAQQLLKLEEGKEIKDQAQINYLKDQQKQLLSQENRQRTAINNQLGVFAKDRGGKTVGGIGGALGRFGSRAGTGLAFAAPLLADTASQFVGDDVSSSGRAAKAGVSALGTTASYAAIGNLIAPGPGALVGAGVGVGLGIYEVIKQLNDIMPEVAQQIEQANTKFNKISSSAQTLSISLETLNSAQERTDLSTETRLRLRNKAEQDFAKSITELNQALPGAGDEIINLYKKIGDTAELREKINEFQIKAQRESKGLAAGGALLGTSEKIKSITDLGIFQKAATLSGAISEEDFRKRNFNNLDESKKLQYDEQIRSGGNQLSDLFANFSKSGGPIGSADIQRIQEAYKSGGGVEGVKSLLDELTRTGSYSKLIGQELKKADALGLVEKYIETWKAHQQEIEVYQKALEEENQKITSGAAKITSLSSLQTQFGLPGGISEKALSNIDYKAIDEGLAGGKRKEFANQVASGITQLSNSIGFSADRLKYLSEYTQKTAEIQKEYNNGIITGTQAFERLKIAMDKIEFEQNKGNMFSGERASANQGIMERQLKQGNFAEGLNPLVSFFDRFGDNAATTADKINKSFGNLAENMQTGFEDAFGAFIDGTKSADDAMRDMMLSISQQIMKEQFSIGMRSLIGGLTGGGGSGEQSGGGGGLLGGIFNSIFGNGKAKGGIIKKYSSGGPVAGGSGVRDDVPAVLTDGEYVLRKSAVNKYGTSMLDMLNRGGMVKGYAGGGSVSSMLNNSYDFFGAKGEKLTQNYTSEAFNTTVNSPSELANIPALTGKFNISDMLSSRAITDENNPMNALRDQRFLGMQSYQQQVSNFKTGYNEQYSQVEEARREAQRQADEINQQRRDQYNKQRSNMIIGGLFSAATSIGGGLLSQFGGGGGGLGGLLGGGGGGGGGLGSIFSQIFSTGSGLLQTALTGGFSSGGGGGQPTISQYQKAQEAKEQQRVSDSIRAGQFSGYGDPFSVQQNRLFPQFGGQSGFGGSGGGFGGNNFGPTSSVGGFQFGVGLGAPAGVQTQFQNSQRDYLMNFASPVAPTAPGRGNMVYDFLNQNSNPFGYNRGFAKGGLVRGYQTGGEADQYLPASSLNLKVKGSDGETYTLRQLGLTTNNTYADLQKKAGQGFGGGYNSPEVLNTMSGIQNALGSNFSRVTGMNDLYHMTRRAEGKSHRSGNKADFTVGDYKTGKQQTIDYLKSIGLSPKDYALTFEGENTPGSTGTHFDFELKKSGKTKVAAMNMSMPTGNIASTNTPAVMAGVGLPSKTSAMYSMTPDMNRNQSTFFKEAGEGVFGAGVGVYGLRKIIDSKLGQKGLMSTLRSAYGGALESSFLPERKYGSNFVKPATARDLTESRFGRRGSLGLKNLPVKKITDPFDFGSRKIGTYLEDFVSMYGQSIKKFNANDPSIVGRGYITSDPNLTVKGKYGSPMIRGSLLYGNSFGAAASTGGREALGSGRALKALLDNPNLSQAALYRVPVDSAVYGPFGIEDAKNPIGNLKTKDLPYDAELLLGKKNKPIARLLALGDEAVSTSQSPILKSIMRNQDKISQFGGSTQNFNQPPPMNRAAGEFSKVMPKQLVDPSEAANILKYAQSGALKPSLLSRSLSGLKGFGAGILKGAAFAPATEFLTPPSLGPTRGTMAYEIEMEYRDLSGKLTPLGERVLGTGNPSISSQEVQSINQQDLLGMNKQSANQILPFFQNLADMASENKQSLYQSVGSLYDMKNKGDYGRLSSKFSSFYGNDSKNRYSSFGEKGFNNYLKYIGADPYSSMSYLNSFKSPMTPNTYSPFAFGSQNFGGFGGLGYQSGFSSTGNAFSNYFSTGSRLGITPSWASRANGGMIYGGTSAKDDVPAMLMGGEYVIRKNIVDKMGEPFFNRLNRGQVQGFAEGGPVGTGLPSIGGAGNTQQDNSRSQFVESISKLVRSLEQLNKGIEEQNRDSKDASDSAASPSDSSSASGVVNNISINVNVDQNGKTTDSTKEEDQSGDSKDETDQEKFKKTMEKSRVLAELLRQQVLKTIVEEQRPGGVLYGGSKGRDMGR